MKYYIPILLQNNEITNILIDEGIKIRRITKKEQEDFFGIENINFGFKDNHVFISSIEVSKNKNGRYAYKTFSIKHILDSTSCFFASNYIIECDTNDNEIDEIVKNLNISFNISKPTSTQCYLGFRDGETDVSFLGSVNYKRILTGFLNFNKKDLKDFPIIYKKIKNLNKKEKLKFELFMDGLHNPVSIELKFISLVIALENMFLPDCSAELKLRFSLRIANIINDKITKKDKKDIFKLAEDIYDIRSKIVHEGSSKKLTTEIYAQTVNMLWVSLVEYINNPYKFKRVYLIDVLL